MKCCCISCLIALLLVIILVCVALFVLTPEMMGIADEPIMNGQSLRDMGLHQLTLFQVVQEIMNLTTPPNEDDFITHTEEDLNNAVTSLDLPKDTSGKVDYSAVIDRGTINSSSQSVTLTGKQTAAVLNDMLKNADSLSSGADADDMAMITENITVAGLEVKQNEAGDETVKITVGIKLRDLMESEGEEIPAELNDIIHDGYTFLSQEFEVTAVDGELKLVEGQEFSDLLINGKESTVLMAFLTGAGGSSSGSSGSDEEFAEAQAMLSEYAVELLNQLGTEDIALGDEGGLFTFKPAA